MGLPNIIQSHINDVNSLTSKYTALETKHNNFETKYNSEVVKLSGNQTIGGTKTFTSIPIVKGGGPAYSLINTDVTKGTNPTANEGWLINCFDSVGTAAKNRLGLFQTAYNTSGHVTVGMWAYQPVADGTTTASVTVVYPASGTPYATAPTPAASSNTTQIATTAWVRGKGVLIESYISGTTWYRKYSDGWIEQGGYFNCSSHGTTITFYKAFANTNYYLDGNANTTTNGIRFASFYNRTTTGAACYTGDDSSFNQGYVYWYACGK